MFEKLRHKWKVGGLQLTLILCTFAIGGSLTGYAARKIMPALQIESNWLWVVIYIVLITLIWPLAVLLISIPFRQFRFFSNYLKKVGKRMGLVSGEKLAVGNQQLAVSSAAKEGLQVTIAIFASGAGSNAQRIIDHFNTYSKGPRPNVRVALIVSNNPAAGILTIAQKENIPTLIIEKEKFMQGNGYADELKAAGIHFIVLAGFLWKLPVPLIKEFSGKIINIHPAMLPNYGGRGMYGHFVHRAVLDNKEKESGITIHYVDELYDHGAIIFQATCAVLENDTVETLAQRVQQLEHEHYPKVIASVIGKVANA
jgi:formyltetrahydrofolate-dependent phosphoribosylglycinamide formyltransferase